MASFMHFSCFFLVIHLYYYSGALKLRNESGTAKHGKEKNREIKDSKKNKKRSREQDKLDYSVYKKNKLRNDSGIEFFESFRDWKKNVFGTSGVTQEQAASSSVINPCNSLESTQNSCMKNKRLGSNLNRKEQGMVIRIKFSFMKHKAPVTANSCIEPCSSTGEVSSLKEETLVKQQDWHSTPANEDPCFSGRVTEDSTIERVAATNSSSSCDSCSSLQVGKCSSDMILNWNPSSLQLHDRNPGSQDWLFSPPRRSSLHGNHSATSYETSKPDDRVSLISASSLQPQACYLPEFDIYQLPYVIPF